MRLEPTEETGFRLSPVSSFPLTVTRKVIFGK